MIDILIWIVVIGVYLAIGVFLAGVFAEDDPILECLLVTIWPLCGIFIVVTYPLSYVFKFGKFVRSKFK